MSMPDIVVRRISGRSSVALRESLARRAPHYLGFGFLLLTIAAIFVPLVWIVTQHPLSDYGGHLAFTEQMIAEGRIPVPNFLFEVLVAAILGLLPGLAFGTAGLVVALVSYLALGSILYVYLRAELKLSGHILIAVVLCGVLTLALLTVQPVSLFSPGQFYLGYLAINPSHTPTMTVMKPFALLVFLLVVRYIVAGATPASPETG